MVDQDRRFPPRVSDTVGQASRQGQNGPGVRYKAPSPVLRGVLAGLVVALIVGITRYDLLRRPGGPAVFWLPLVKTVALVTLVGLLAGATLYALAKREWELYRLADWSKANGAVYKQVHLSRVAAVSAAFAIAVTAIADFSNVLHAHIWLSALLYLSSAVIGLISFYATRLEKEEEFNAEEERADRLERERLAAQESKRKAEEEEKRKAEEKRIQEAEEEEKRKAAAEEARRERERYINSLLEMPIQTLASESVGRYDVGVARSAWADREIDPYIVRDNDAQLKQALRKSRFVIVVGQLKAGKSRTAYEQAVELFPSAALVVPRRGHPNVLSKLRGPLLEWNEPLVGPLVIWLDCLEQYLTARNDLDLLAVSRILSQRQDIVIVATITSRNRARLWGLGDDTDPVRRCIAKASSIEIKAPPSATERVEAKTKYPELDFTHSIGEPIAATRELEIRYQDGIEACPIGWSIVRAAIDWHRTDIGRPINGADLRQLQATYLSRLPADIECNNHNFEQGMLWARTPIAAHEALLMREQLRDAPYDGYNAHPHIVRYVDGQGQKDPSDIPHATWEFARDHATPEELLRIAAAARLRGN